MGDSRFGRVDPDADHRLKNAYARRAPATPHLEETDWERLLDQELNLVEREAALAHVTACRECASVYRGLIEFERQARGIDPAAPVEKTGAARMMSGFPVWIGALAASIAIAILGWTMYRIQFAPAPAAVESKAEPTAPNAPPATAVAKAEAPTFVIEKLPVRISSEHAMAIRSAGDDPKAFLTDFGRALEPYRADDFDEAARRLGALGLKYPRAVEPPLYEGMSLLLLHRPAQAIVALDRAIALSKADAFRADAEYHAAIARIEAGQTAGRDALARICSADGPYKTKACTALASRPPAPER